MVADFLYFFNSNSEVVGIKSEMRAFFRCILTFTSFCVEFAGRFIDIVDRTIASVFNTHLVGGSFSGKVARILLTAINPVLTVMLAGYTVFFVIILWVYRTFSFLLAPIVVSFVLFLMFTFASMYAIIVFLLNFVSSSRIAAVITILPL